MTVYRGVLEKMSAGAPITRQHRGRIHYGEWYGEGSRDSQFGLMQRQFIDVGGKHIRNAILDPYQDEVLAEAVGQEVAISAYGSRAGRAGRTTVVAVRTAARGRVRPGFTAMVVALLVGAFKTLLAAFVMALGAFLLTALLKPAVGDQVSWLVFVAMLVGVGVFLLAWVRATFNSVRAWAAI